MYYIIYKTTCLINQKIYIGQHQSEKLQDDYLGSGVSLGLAIEKYGRENFIRENLFVFDNFDEMNNKEIEIVNEEFLKRDDVYNIKLGGNFLDNNRCNDNIFVNGCWIKNEITRESRLIFKTVVKEFLENNLGWSYGRICEDEKFLRKQSEITSNKRWIYNKVTEEELYIHKDLAEKKLKEESWVRGRIKLGQNKEFLRKQSERVKRLRWVFNPTLDEEKYIYVEDLDKYIYDGSDWKRGRNKKKFDTPKMKVNRKSNIIGKIGVRNNETKKIKYIWKEELLYYESLGFSYGKKKN